MKIISYQSRVVLYPSASSFRNDSNAYLLSLWCISRQLHNDSNAQLLSLWCISRQLHNDSNAQLLSLWCISRQLHNDSNAQLLSLWCDVWYVIENKTIPLPTQTSCDRLNCWVVSLLLSHILCRAYRKISYNIKYVCEHRNPWLWLAVEITSDYIVWNKIGKCSRLLSIRNNIYLGRRV